MSADTSTKTHRITVKAVTGVVLTFTGVKDYSIEEGFIVFIDQRTGDTVKFWQGNAQIVEEDCR